MISLLDKLIYYHIISLSVYIFLGIYSCFLTQKRINFSINIIQTRNTNKKLTLIKSTLFFIFKTRLKFYFSSVLMNVDLKALYSINEESIN